MEEVVACVGAMCFSYFLLKIYKLKEIVADKEHWIREQGVHMHNLTIRLRRANATINELSQPPAKSPDEVVPKAVYRLVPLSEILNHHYQPRPTPETDVPSAESDSPKEHGSALP